VARLPSFTVRLLAFYDRGHRDLPWRRTNDPWAIWVSEIMLQQTRVDVVQRLYPRFMRSYPRPADFAATSDDELLGAWQGLGYYRRARLLRDGARRVAEVHEGVVPTTPDALSALPGVGSYTRGAIGSIAFGIPLPAIDGNVERVLARHRGIRMPIKTGAGAQAVRALVEELLDHDRPGDFNQAMMELGATVCTPRATRCQECPVASDCIARRQNLVAQLPILPPRRRSVDVAALAVLVPGVNRTVLGHRIPIGDINEGQVDLPGPGPLISCDFGDLARSLRERFDRHFELEGEVGTVRHGITNHRITMRAYWARCGEPIVSPLLAAYPTDDTVPWTTLARKVFRLASMRGASSSP
jgi:A/G-specific adenine glycosylase